MSFKEKNMRKNKKMRGKGVSKKEETTARPTPTDEVRVPIERDKLATQIAESINSQFKEFRAVHFLGGNDTEASDVYEWISTGDDILDLRISNRPNGGIPVGRITEITGLESSGKSLVVAHLIAEAQKKGGIAVLFDTEFAASPQFLDAIGVNTTNMLHVQLECLEDVFSTMEKMIMDVREKHPDRLLLIAVDSIMGATTKVEMEQDYDKEGWATAKAIIMSKAMRKLTALIAKQRIALVFTNQLREKLGAMFGDKYTTAGGKALGFHSSVRIRLDRTGRIKVGKEVLGVTVRAQITKNRVGPPFRIADMNIYFDRGIDRYGSWLNAIKLAEIGTVSGGTKPKVSLKGGVEIPTKKWNETLSTDAELREKIYGMICESFIMKYKSSSETLDEAEISEDTSEE
jgi:recombination protein RecA